MAKAKKQSAPVAQSKIEIGAMVAGKNVVKVFEAGDIVEGIDEKTLASLVAGGSVKMPDADAGDEALSQ